LNGLGEASLSLEDFAGAERHYLDSLRMAYDLGQDREMLGVLMSLARIRVATGSVDNAVELLSTVAADPAGAQQLPFQSAPIHAVAAEMQEQLAQDMEPEDYGVAVAAGGGRTTTATVRELLGIEPRRGGNPMR